MSDNVEQKAECRNQARGLASTKDKLETGVLTVFWDQVLLNSLALLSIEHELLRELDVADIINRFSISKASKHFM